MTLPSPWILQKVNREKTQDQAFTRQCLPTEDTARPNLYIVVTVLHTEYNR